MKRPVGPRPKTLEACIEKMYESNTTLSKRSIDGYCEDASRACKKLRAAGYNYFPWTITDKDIAWLLEEYRKEGKTVETRRRYLSAMRAFTELYGNNTIKELKIRWPHEERIYADWLNSEQAKALADLDLTALQLMIVHCELCLGLRRIEVIHLTVESFDNNLVHVLGKGPQGGKSRDLAYHEDTEYVLNQFLKYRNDMIAAVKSSTTKDVEVPNNLLIYRRGKKLYSYAEKGTGIDAIVKPLGKMIGYPKMSNHTLRRTFARTLYHDGVRVEVISQILGHDSVKTTIRYLGLNLDDQQDAMKKCSLRMRRRNA